MLTVLQGDCIERMRELPEKSAHCCVCSPPYWGLRQYLFDKAVVVRDDLSDVEQAFILSEIEKRGIKPRVPSS